MSWSIVLIGGRRRRREGSMSVRGVGYEVGVGCLSWTSVRRVGVDTEGLIRVSGRDNESLPTGSRSVVGIYCLGRHSLPLILSRGLLRTSLNYFTDLVLLTSNSPASLYSEPFFLPQFLQWGQRLTLPLSSSSKSPSDPPLFKSDLRFLFHGSRHVQGLLLDRSPPSV